MGRLYCIMGKSASGKDTIFRELLKRNSRLLTYVMYTTRPMRAGETDGVSYHFTDRAALEQAEREGRLIESRCYDTVYGPWIYATVDDGTLDPGKGDYLLTGTLESYAALRAYFGTETVVPVYIYVDDGERLLRAVMREMKEEAPRYTELCRRFIADSEDFSDERLKAAGITRFYINDGLERCIEEITAVIDGRT